MSELWKPVKDFEDQYVVTSYGRVARISNLEWVTRSENQKHAYRNGLQKKVFGRRGPLNGRWKGGSATTTWRRKKEAECYRQAKEQV